MGEVAERGGALLHFPLYAHNASSFDGASTGGDFVWQRGAHATESILPFEGIRRDSKGIPRRAIRFVGAMANAKALSKLF